jgi:hypothetical protein
MSMARALDFTASDARAPSRLRGKIAELLRMLGYEVVEAGTAAEAGSRRRPALAPVGGRTG